MGSLSSVIAPGSTHFAMVPENTKVFAQAFADSQDLTNIGKFSDTIYDGGTRRYPKPTIHPFECEKAEMRPSGNHLINIKWL